MQRSRVVFVCVCVHTMALARELADAHARIGCMDAFRFLPAPPNAASLKRMVLKTMAISVISTDDATRNPDTTHVTNMKW
jgi:hypothetical protein